MTAMDAAWRFCKNYGKFLLLWPLFTAYRRKLRRSVRWRLADSHITTVWSSVLALCLILFIGTLAWAWFSFPSGGELPNESSDLATMIQSIQAAHPMTDDEMSTVLAALTTGSQTANPRTSEPVFQLSVGSTSSNIESISIVSPTGTVVSSSNPSYVGQPLATSLPGAAALYSDALNAAGNGDRVSATRFSDGSAIGAVRIRDATGDVAGVLVLQKSSLTFPTAWVLMRKAASLIAQLGILVLIAVGIPAIPISIAIGVKRGRAISKPISALADASERLADGDLDSRVAVRGEDEISTLQRGFNAMAERLQTSLEQESRQRARSEELLAANRELVANVSHELRTPVALIRGHLEAIEGDPANANDYIRIAVRETDRLEHLVEDLFQLTRLESKRLNLDLAPFDAGSAAREAVEALAEPARREAGILVRAETGPGEIQCAGDRARFVQVLMNLIRNAIRYTPEGGIILISTAGLADRVRVSVHDTGAGIPAADLPHIFDRFYRADPSRNRASGGAGLGLSIAKELIDAMGGSIAVESELGEGTTFAIDMPRAVSTPPAANGYSLAGSRSK